MYDTVGNRRGKAHLLVPLNHFIEKYKDALSLSEKLNDKGLVLQDNTC